MDHIAALKTFCRVVEAGSFARAADSLDLPKPTVTRLIQNLEQEFGSKLLHRTTRRISVTVDGAVVYDRSLGLLADLDDLRASIGDARTSPRGPLRVDLPTSLGMAVVLPALPRFRELYPDIDLSLGLSDRAVDLITDNVDCVVRGGAAIEPSLVARKVACVGRLLCASPDYLRRHGQPLQPEDLANGHVMVRYMSSRSLQVRPVVVQHGDKSAELQSRKQVVFNDNIACVEAAVAGLGVTDAVEFLAIRHLEAGRLLPVLAGWSSPTIPLYVVYPRNRHLAHRVRVFIDWLIELLAGLPLLQRETGVARSVPREADAV
ncbi:MAG TPA: LysR family transcriptional regulator [Ideonella sp.]|nr:LysR family transcriptional regulator [Ideonella sp.]